jgi:hypothetical protein
MIRTRVETGERDAASTLPGRFGRENRRSTGDLRGAGCTTRGENPLKNLESKVG